MDRVALFVDVQNVYYTTREAYSCHFDYRSFWRQVGEGREIVRAIAYAIDRGDAAQRRFQEILTEIGFEVKLKPFIQRRDGSSKGDWDVGIALDMMDFAEDVDVVVLVSGDGDFALALERVEQKFGVSTEVYGVPPLTADSLVRAAARFVPISKDLLLAPRKANRS